MPKDGRLYARFDIGMDEHPKIMLLSDAAFRALIECTMYARRQLNDGFIALGVAHRRWGQEAADELCSNDPERPSWFRTEKGGVAGYQIHDYDKHQTTTADIEDKRAAGRAGAAARWAAKDATPMAPAMAPAMQTAMRSDATTLAKTETETETTPSNEGVSAPTSKSSRRKPETPLADGWGPANSAYEYAQLHGLDIRHEESQFRNHAAANDRRQRDWDAAFRTWLGNAKKYQPASTQPKLTAAQRNMQTVALFREDEERQRLEIEG
ncbi:hypothetical protein [Rathayibacter sp. AY2B9]|uniref:hypothetical protein n=1 Tax=Rathayibacter sp. AY2B9 TaxID=2080572 RepID=UPI000CE7D65B|nr:hypothetical protein [Rathayibacter sp. AY2B9]PPG34508.1 hypothetical protein C5C25_00360 [Rathayibacter sp. AY2B9]